MVVLSVSVNASSYPYTPILLTPLPGDTHNQLYDLNDSGQAVGLSSSSDDHRNGVVWNPVNSPINIGNLPGGGHYTVATGVNNTGHVAGYSRTVSGDYLSERAFIWDSANGMTNIGRLPSSVGRSNALSINSLGEVVGYSNTSTTSNSHAFLWDSTNGMQDLGDLPGGNDYSLAYDVNDSSQVVGYSDTQTGTNPSTGQPIYGDRAFLWDSVNGMVDLGSLPAIDGWSNARAINNVGQVVGVSRALIAGGGEENHAFIWDTTNGMVDLGVLPDGNSSYALDINNAGEVVGNSKTTGLKTHAVLWDTQGNMIDLNTLVDPLFGYTLKSAVAINNSGHILASASDYGGSGVYLLLVPEPATLGLVLVGGLALLRRRRR
ncbi:MAG: DUF3466 family protein [Phycisphaerae bacterium]|nr:DUF3466 family protein [Phycisphaerae bacterium]